MIAVVGAMCFFVGLTAGIWWEGRDLGDLKIQVDRLNEDAKERKIQVDRLNEDAKERQRVYEDFLARVRLMNLSSVKSC